MTSAGAFYYQYNRYFAKVPLNCHAKYDATGILHTGNFGPPAPAAADSHACSGWQPATTVDNPPTTKNLAIFAQDSWKVLKNLTVNFGIRYEEQKLLDASGGTAIKINGEWSPRLGIIWDPMSNGRSKVYASFGRYYSTIPQDIQTRALGNEYTVFAYQYDARQAPRSPRRLRFLRVQTMQGGELTQADLKGMYQDEIDRAASSTRSSRAGPSASRASTRASGARSKTAATFSTRASASPPTFRRERSRRARSSTRATTARSRSSRTRRTRPARALSRPRASSTATASRSTRAATTAASS